MRPPCCEKSGMKKGAWSPEEDLLLASYVHEHGAGNWRAVPANTGLMRCSKSCHLRWTNNLRPGIKPGNFSDLEEKLIIHLQLLLGNKWSTIASYMPERTDNDIKNFFNTHLKRKIAKTSATESGASGSAKTKGNKAVAADKGQWERHLQTDVHTACQAFQEALSMNTASPSMKSELVQVLAPNLSPAMYACSVQNIARLLEDWPMRHSTNGKALAVSGGGEGGSGSHSGPAHTLEAFTGTRKVEDAGGAGLGPSSLSLRMLESWLLDDDVGHGDMGLMCVPLADPSEFF